MAAAPKQTDEAGSPCAGGVAPAEFPQAIAIRPAAAWLWIVSFLASIALPGVLGLCGIASEFRIDLEKRNPTPWPQLSVSSLLGRQAEATARKLEASINDRFGLRGMLLRWQIGLEQQVLPLRVEALYAARNSKRYTAIQGHAGFTFLANQGSLESVRRNDPFTEEELADWARLLQTRHDYLAARGIRYVVLIGPNKGTIYPEHVPEYVGRLDAESRFDQFAAYLAAHTTIEFIDVRPALFAAKADRLLYYPRDTHWNMAAGLIACRELATQLGVQHPILSFDQYAEQTIGNSPCYDEGEILGLPNTTPTVELIPRYPRAAAAVTPINTWIKQSEATTNPHGVLPRTLVFHDSFFQFVRPYLSELCTYVEYGWTYDFRPDVIDAVQPQLVIEQFVERRLTADMPKPMKTRPSTPRSPLAAQPGDARLRR